MCACHCPQTQTTEKSKEAGRLAAPPPVGRAEFHGHLGFSSTVFIAKINVSSQYSRVHCLSPVCAKHSSHVAEEGAGSPGDKGQVSPGHLLMDVLGSHTSHGLRAAHRPPAASARPTAARWPAEGWLYRLDWPAAPETASVPPHCKKGDQRSVGRVGAEQPVTTGPASAQPPRREGPAQRWSRAGRGGV